MKRIALALGLIALLGSSAFADHPAGTGVGLVASSNYGSAGFGSQIGLSLKLRQVPLYWGLRLALNSSYLALGATADQYFTDAGLIRQGAFKLDWFLGLGGYANLSLASTPGASVGARLPIGLSWHITNQFELWLDVAPSLGVSVVPSFNFPDWSVPGELGFRVWL